MLLFSILTKQSCFHVKIDEFYLLDDSHRTSKIKSLLYEEQDEE